MALFDFFRAIWLSYLNDLSLAEQVLAALPFAAYLFSVPFAVRRHYRGANKNLAIELAEEKQAAQKWLVKYNDANAEIEALARRLPENWQKLVEAERLDGNEARATGLLRDEFRNAEKPLALAASQLAEHHASVAFDLGEEHLAEARRYCRLALLHGGENAEISALLDEIETMLPVTGRAPSGNFSGWDDIHDALPSGADSSAVIDSLNRATDNQLGLGHFHLAATLNRRAIRIAKRDLDGSDNFTLSTRFLKARVLHCLGQDQAALDEINAFLPLEVRALPPNHRDVFVTRHLLAQVLGRLGRHETALEEIAAYAPLQVRALSPDHPDVLATRYLKAELLSDLGRYTEALDEIDLLTALRAKSMPPVHRSVLATRHLKAEVLARLGRHQEAFDEIEAFAPLQVAILSPDHPDVLTTRFLKAQVLAMLNQHQTALSEIEAFAPHQTIVLGSDHVDVLTTRHLKAQVLDLLGNYQAALDEIGAYDQLQVSVLSSNHQSVLATRYLKARVLNRLGQHETALEEINVIAPLLEKALPPDHPDVIETGRLREQIKEALAERIPA